MRFAEKKDPERDRDEKERGVLWENAKQLKGRSAEHWVHSVSDNMSQWLKPGRCQQPARFTVITVITRKRRGEPVSTSHIQNKHITHKHPSLRCLLNVKTQEVLHICM